MRTWVQCQISKGQTIQDVISEALEAHVKRMGFPATLVWISDKHPDTVTAPDGVTLVRTAEVHSPIEAWAGVTK